MGRWYVCGMTPMPATPATRKKAPQLKKSIKPLIDAQGRRISEELKAFEAQAIEAQAFEAQGVILGSIAAAGVAARSE